MPNRFQIVRHFVVHFVLRLFRVYTLFIGTGAMPLQWSLAVLMIGNGSRNILNTAIKLIS